MIEKIIPGKGETLDSIRDIKIIQRKQGYRFSVDALLLFSFVNIPHCRMIADFGAGSGIVSILLAKKYPEAKVFAIEIQEGLSSLAMKNVTLNNLENRVKIIKKDIRNLPEDLPWDIFGISREKVFNLIVSNPPFRKPLTGLLSPEKERAIARHEIKITIDDILKASSLLLTDKGRIDLIYHPVRMAELFLKMKRYGLEPKRLRFIHSKEGTEAKMMLVEGVKGGRGGLKIDRPLFIYDTNGGYTEEMNEIYGLR